MDWPSQKPLNKRQKIANKALFAFFFTYAMLWAINLIPPVRVAEHEEDAGLDATNDM